MKSWYSFYVECNKLVAATGDIWLHFPWAALYWRLLVIILSFDYAWWYSKYLYNGYRLSRSIYTPLLNFVYHALGDICNKFNNLKIRTWTCHSNLLDSPYFRWKQVKTTARGACRGVWAAIAKCLDFFFLELHISKQKVGGRKKEKRKMPKPQRACSSTMHEDKHHRTESVPGDLLTFLCSRSSCARTPH